ncbi:MAG: hypothetical protein FWE98_05125 [Oscillospiraceae bacterium]|nr:hypothetical protein [Oscillospiraceae bacterium]
MKKPFARLLTTLLAALLLCGALLLAVGAQGVDITDKFTDPVFRAAVQEIIKKDIILDTDVAGINYLDVSRYTDPNKIKSLAGLAYFTALQSLYCADNELTALPELPPGLETLHCAINQITALPTLPDGLRFLYCGHNQLAELPALPADLKILYCRSNQLTSLPTLPTGLWKLDCSLNQLSGLDVTGLQLGELDCRFNNMRSSSDVKGFTGIWRAIDISYGRKYFFYPQNPTYFWSTWPPIAQWALEYILFGWLWMRWL